MKTLREIQPGEDCVVTKITGEGAIKRRIMDMGLTKGTTLHVRKAAPIEITVRGYELSVRKADAEMVQVETK